jgi:hypothetical protein
METKSVILILVSMMCMSYVQTEISTLTVDNLSLSKFLIVDLQV